MPDSYRHSFITARRSGGIRNVLGELVVLGESPTTLGTHTVFRDDTEALIAEQSGLFESNPDTEVGDRVQSETHLGTVYCPASFEELQSVTAPESGVIYSLTRETVVAGRTSSSLATS